MMCNRAGCQAPATDQVGMAIWAPLKRGKPAIATMDLFVCMSHREAITIDDVVTDEGWNILAAAFEATGHVRPDRSLLELHFQPLQ